MMEEIRQCGRPFTDTKESNGPITATFSDGKIPRYKRSGWLGKFTLI